MLLHYTRLRNLLLVVLALLQVSESGKPVIWPNQTEILINEGEALEITCNGTTRIKFIYPNMFEDTINTSIPEMIETENNGTYKFVFRRPHTVFGDTGWYGCVNYDVDIFSNFNDNSEVNWIYVYVNSSTHLFVETDNYISLNAIVGDNIAIPCRTTSPDLVPILYISDEKMDKPFNPRIGFMLENLAVENSDWYKCLIEKNDISQEIFYILTVHPNETLFKPIINDDNLRYVIRGEDLHVNCTVHVSLSMRYLFNWTTPQQSSSKINTEHFTRHLDGHTLEVTCQLTIFNVTDDDAGEYECFIKSIHGMKSTTRNITIYDPQNKFISLTPQHPITYYQAESGSTMQWVVYIDGYPTPYTQWFNMNGAEITNNSKYSVTTTSTTTILKIRSLTIIDNGVYMLEAKNDAIIQNLNFTLDVMAKPYSLLAEVESYYTPNENAEFHCEVISFPPPNITLSFLKCPNYPSLENSTTVQLIDSMQTETSYNIKFISRAKMLIESSGKITCEACNTLGCDVSTEIIFVSDGVGAFGIIEPKELVTIGDVIEFTCAASIYNYTEDLTWTNRNQTLIVETERLHIIRHKTLFTYQSTIKINNIQKSDAQDYICIGKYISSNTILSEDAIYRLVVHDPVLPTFDKSNMNKTKVREIDVITDGHKTVILQCFISGLPKPTLTWYKDDTLLKENDQYFFKHDYQELNIKYLKKYDSGKYSCRATNRLGTSENYQQITIKPGAWEKHEIGLSILISVLAFFLVILGIFYIIRIRREKKMKRELMEAGLTHFEEGALECLNPDLTVDDQAELLPYDKKWEFSREKLKLGKQLGSGAFGVVMKAEAQGICDNETVTTVAVKMVRRTTDPTYVRALASELKIMVHLGKHLNVVNLLGACTKNISKRELLVIVEYCRFGNLHNYLLKHRTDFINQIDPKTGKLDFSIGIDILARSASVNSNNRIKYAALSFSRSLNVNSGTDTVVCYSPETNPDVEDIGSLPDGCVVSNNSSQPGWRSNYHGDYKDQNLKPICTQDLLSWAFQVARGMEYLSHRRVLHGDLAARNILLAENNIVKICDFGLAKSMYKDDNYKKKGDSPLPIKWMAIESIRDRIFSTQSDVWSFGIVLWEFFSLAKTPYPGMEAEKQYQKLIEGYRMEQPEYAIAEVYDIMLQCWKAKPTLRPSFSDLVEDIGNLLEESVKSHYISLNTPYMDMNEISKDGKNDYLTMMSAPDHTILSSPTITSNDYVNAPFSESASNSTYLCMSPGCQTNESGIFSPRPNQQHTHFEFPSPASDSEDAIELSPMLKQEEDPYLKPINVQARRAEFARQRQTIKNQMADRPIDRDSGYCNTPRNLRLIDLNDVDENDSIGQTEADEEDLKKKDFTPSIIRTQNNYINMPKQKNNLRKDMPDSFSNPGYIMMSDQKMDQTV